jgi:hypothetical protein
VIRKLLAALVFAVALPAAAVDESILIQTAPDGRYSVWHSRGETALTGDDIAALEGAAHTGGAMPLETAAVPASAVETKGGVVITQHAATRDRTLLVDHDACGGTKLWHSEGDIALTDEQLTELVISALPTGGKSVRIGDSVAKAYTIPIGVVVVIWQRVKRNP